MLKPRYFMALLALIVSGGTAMAQPSSLQRDGGTGAGPGSLGGRYGGIGRPRLLTTLDGRAIAAAYAAVGTRRDLLLKEDKRSAGNCEASPKAMDVIIAEAESMYVIRIDRRVDRCGWADPSFNAVFNPEFYAVSPEGKILMRYPYTHEVPLVHRPVVVNGIRWPEESRLRAILDGSAVFASYVAMQGFITRFVRETKSVGNYNPSPKDVDVLVFELEDMYAVRINPRAGTRGWVDPNLRVGLEPEVFVVSPEGKLLGRFPDSLSQLLQPVLRMSPGRMVERYPVGPRADAGAHTEQPAADGGVGWPEGLLPLRIPATDGGIRWPEEMLPLAILDGPAIAASSAAMQHLQARLKKKYGEACLASASAMQVLVGREGELYFVRIEQHSENCGSAAPGAYMGADEVALYAVTPDGHVRLLDPEEP